MLCMESTNTLLLFWLDDVLYVYQTAIAEYKDQTNSRVVAHSLVTCVYQYTPFFLINL